MCRGNERERQQLPRHIFPRPAEHRACEHHVLNVLKHYGHIAYRTCNACGGGRSPARSRGEGKAEGNCAFFLSLPSAFPSSLALRWESSDGAPVANRLCFDHGTTSKSSRISRSRTRHAV